MTICPKVWRRRHDTISRGIGLAHTPAAKEDRGRRGVCADARTSTLSEKDSMPEMTKETPSAAGPFDRAMLFVRRLCRVPGGVYRRLEDGVTGPALARARGMRHGRRLRMVGSPFVSCHPQAEIVLGDDVLINSRPGPHYPCPCTLEARMPGARVVIGNGVSMSGTRVIAHVSIEIGDRTMIGSETEIVDTDFHPMDPARRAQHPTEGADARPVTIGRDVFIGMRSIILKGVTIGDGAIVGAGSVVATDVKPGQVVFGNPARLVVSFVRKKIEENKE